MRLLGGGAVTTDGAGITDTLGIEINGQQVQQSCYIEVCGSRWATMNGSRGHWAEHQGLMDTWKGLAYYAAQRLSPPPTLVYPVRVEFLVCRTTNARSDAHNLAPTMKAVLDGIVLAGILTDDSDDQIRETVIRRGANRDRPTLGVRIS